MSEVPWLEIFTDYGNGPRNGKWVDIVRGIQPNTPFKTDLTDTVHARQLRVAAHRHGKPLRMRTVDGVVWACWVVDEDAK